MISILLSRARRASRLSISVREICDKTVLDFGYCSIVQAVEARLAPFDCAFLRWRGRRAQAYRPSLRDELLPQLIIVFSRAR